MHNKNKELTYEQLINEWDAEKFTFETTEDIDPYDDIIGQDRAVTSMELGLNMDIRGYNIYMSGASGTGKTTYAEAYVKKIAKKKPVPDDWCYVYNFDKSSHPIAIQLPAGQGKEFKKYMEAFVEIIRSEIPKAFNSEDYEKQKTSIVTAYQNKRSVLLEQLGKDAEKQGFKVKKTSAGIYFLPIIEGKTLSEEEYAELEEQKKVSIREKSEKLQIETLDIVRKMKEIEKQTEESISEWENKIALLAVGVHMNDIKEKYEKHEKIVSYLDNVQQDILDNLDDFIEEQGTEEQSQMMLLASLAGHTEGPEEKYKVNVLIDNSDLKGAPVIVDFNPTYYNLVGKAEYESEQGSIITDYTMIKSGLLHQANGGYLILQADDVLRNMHVWEALKRALRTKKITVENLQEHLGLTVVSTLRPEPIPLNVKVLLVGSTYLYHLLLQYDEDFKKLFKIKADFDEEMEKTTENVNQLAGFVASFCRREDVLPFHKTAIAKLVNYSSRLVENREKLSTRFNDVVEILAEAATWARLANQNCVMAADIKKAIEQKEYRSKKYDERLLHLLEEGTIMIDTEGSVIGQINGLSVLDLGDYSFGKPSRITAATYIGKSGIVNIEREIEMSGTSHSKGVMILAGYIGQKYAQELPLALTASVCFEQLYNGVDGDSASSTELYSILSSLAQTPIYQGIAVTGSVNQRGEIQPIGGVNQKIEGFFEVCSQKGLTGEQGVIIPYQNIKHLVLKQEILEAVKKGIFHIYPVKTVDEGIEILTGIAAGQKDEQGKYLEGTINEKVYSKLKSFSQKVYK